MCLCLIHQVVHQAIYQVVSVNTPMSIDSRIIQANLRTMKLAHPTSAHSVSSITHA